MGVSRRRFGIEGGRWTEASSEAAVHLIVGGASLYIEVVRHDYALFFSGCS